MITQQKATVKDRDAICKSQILSSMSGRADLTQRAHRVPEKHSSLLCRRAAEPANALASYLRWQVRFPALLKATGVNIIP